MIYLNILMLGGLTTAMITANSLLASGLGQVPAMVIIHFMGLLPTGAAFLHDRKPSIKAPFHLYLAGPFGVFITFTNALCIQIMGASLTVSLMVAGQLITALIIDSQGFFNREKQEFTAFKAAAALTALGGVFYMSDSFRGSPVPIFLALFAGMINQINMLLNAELAERIGIKKGTMMNFLTGLGVSLLLLLSLYIFRPEILIFSPGKIPALPAFTGGLMGALLVFGLNRNLPEIPVFKGAVLLYAGQIVIGALMDLFLLDLFSYRTLTGILMIFLALYLNGKKLRIRAY